MKSQKSFDLIHRFVFDSTDDEEDVGESEDVNFAPLIDAGYDQFGQFGGVEVSVKEEKTSAKKEQYSRATLQQLQGESKDEEANSMEVNTQSCNELTHSSPAEADQVDEGKLNEKRNKINEKNVCHKNNSTGRCKHPYSTITFDQLKKKNSNLACKLMKYRKSKLLFRGNVHICGLTLQGKCNYMSYASSALRLHLKIHEEKNVQIFKVIDIPHVHSNFRAFLKAKRKPTYVTMQFAQLEAKHPKLAQEVLSQHRSNLKYRTNIHFCSLQFTGRCDHMSYCGAEVYRHVKLHHPDADVSVIKVVAYPNEQMCGSIYSYELINYVDLKERDPKLAKTILDYHSKFTNKRNIHLCGLNFTGRCDYYSYNGFDVVRHTQNRHKSEPVTVYKVIGYPKSGG